MKSAVITQSSGKSVVEKRSSGLFSCLLEHKVTETSANFQWTGPKISPAEWAKMMAFFEWTQETEKSEAQVRWYVHPVQGWRCWAFPQKGGTSMTTLELPEHPSWAAQRSLFPDTEGWVYFKTVHHHCNCGAFQSGTDEADEKKQDGLHITIGNMDKPQRDIHCRLYIEGNKFEPMMESFWDIGDEVRAKADEFTKLFGVTPDMNKVARLQMAQSSELLRRQYGIADAPEDQEDFPEQWKDNYIVTRYTPTTTSYSGDNYYDRVYGHRGIKAPARNGASETYQPGTTWCSICNGWTKGHTDVSCPYEKLSRELTVNQGPYTDKGPEIKLTKKQRKLLKKQKEEADRRAAAELVKDASAVKDDGVLEIGEEFDAGAINLYNDIRSYATAYGYTDEDFTKLLMMLTGGDDAAVITELVSELADTMGNVKLEDLMDIDEACAKAQLEMALKGKEAEKPINGNQVDDSKWGHYIGD
jgi:hypothetical protein